MLYQGSNKFSRLKIKENTEESRRNFTKMERRKIDENQGYNTEIQTQNIFKIQVGQFSFKLLLDSFFKSNERLNLTE